MNWFLAILSAFILGLSRGGLKGIAPLFVLLMAAAFGGKASTGIIVPLLIIGDLFALYFYKRFIQRKYVVAFLPWVLMGVLIGVWLGKDLPEIVFKKALAVLIVASMLMMWLWDFYLKKELKTGLALTGVTGIGSGLFSMLGNFAGAFANIYFLMTRLPRKQLIGTATFIFFIVNLIKIPFHIFIWETISLRSLKIDAYLLPTVMVGFFAGLKIVEFVSEKWFRQFLYVVTFLGALLIFWK